MPQVPKLVSSVKPEALPGPRLSAGSSAEGFGADIGRELVRASAQVYEEEKRKAEEIEFMRVNRQLQEYSNAKLYDPKNGALNRKGRDSFSLPEEVLPDFDKKISEIGGTIRSENVRRAFHKSADGTRNNIDLTVQRHVFQERERYDTEETNAFIKTSRESAMFNYNDPVMVAGQISNQLDTIRAYAERTGKGANWAKAEFEDARSKTHAAVIERALASGDDKYASAYYAEVKNDIKSDESIRVAKLVQDGSYQGASQRAADKLIAEIGGNRVEFMKEIAKIQDPKLRDAVQTRVEHHLNIIDKIQRDDRENIFDYLSIQVDKGASYESLDVGMRDKLSLGQKDALRRYAKLRNKGESPDTQWSTYYKLQQDAIADPAKFSKIDLMQYRDKLDDVEFKEIVGLQRMIGRKDNEFDSKINGYRTVHQIVNDSLNAISINPNPKDGTSDSRSVAQFRRLVDEQIINFERMNGRKPNTTEIQATVDTLLVKGKIPGSGFIWNSSKRVFELKPGEGIVAKIEDIPLAERIKIEDALKRNRSPATNDEIIRLFNLKAQSMTAGPR